VQARARNRHAQHHHHARAPAATRRNGVPAVDVPRRSLTPGAAFDVGKARIFVSGYSASVRNVPQAEATSVYDRYGVAHIEARDWVVAYRRYVGGTPTAAGDRSAPAGGSNAGGYYASSFRTASTIHCADDSDWRELSARYFKYFRTWRLPTGASPPITCTGPAT
jgi:hypothetical protein